MGGVEHRVSAELKSKVLSELSVPGCLISDIASRYGISRGTVYKWRHNPEKAEETKAEVKQQAVAGKFIELSLQEELKRAKLTKAELVFDSFSLLITGNFDSNKLLKIISAAES